MTQALPWHFVLDLAGSYSYHPYDHRSSYDQILARYVAGAGPKRKDDIWDVQAELRYPITDWAELSVRGQYTDNASNVKVFDYDRWIAGGYLTLYWNNK